MVDYSSVPIPKPEDGPILLKIAQWYDYWPGSFLVNFKNYMKRQYGLDVRTQWDVYTSNEELFQLITLGKRRYDVMFPTSYYSDLYKQVGMIYNLNEEWLPNLKNLDWDLITRPRDQPWFRRDSDGAMIGVPYFWGTTGVGFRTDKISKEDAGALGYAIFEKSTWKGVVLKDNMRMLDEMNDVFTAGFKMAGWEWQKSQGLEPSGLLTEYGGHQWTSSETDPARVRECGKWIAGVRPNLFGFNSTEAYTSLVLGTSYVNQAWSGDMSYAMRLGSNNPQPVDYVIPHQGSTIWFDCVCIHSKSRNLWVAHEFINFIHDVTQNVTLTRWNEYATPNKAAFDALTPAPNGFDIRTGRDGKGVLRMPWAYPNVNMPESLKVCDLAQYTSFDVLMNLYNPLWAELTGD